MNYREKYLELEEKYTRLEKELKLLKTRKKKSQAPSTKVIEDNKDIGNVLTEIFNTISSYLALFRFGEDGRFYVIDINKKVEEVELTDRNDIVGKCIDDTPFSKRRKLIELLNHVQKFKVAHKIPASDAGDDSEGFYMGFILTSGNIIITWEPGKEQKIADDIYRQSMLFQTFAELLPGIIYEIDLEGRVVYGNKMGLDLFGFSKEDLKKGLFISDVFPEIAANMFMNLQALKSPGEISSNEYFVKRHDGALIPIVTHSFAIFHEGKKIGYRGTVTDVSKHKHIETEIIKQKAFLENLIDSTPEAIVITDPLGKITMVNKEFTNLFGYTYEEAVNEDIDDLIVPERLRDEAFAITNLVSLHQKEVRQTVRKDKSGNELQVSLVATGIIINKETVANIGIYRNITTEKKNQVLQEVLYNISSAALKQMDIKELYPTIVKELSKIWDTNNFFIALYDKKTETLSLPFFSDEKDSFNEIPISKTITGYLIKTNQSVLLKEKDLRLLEESGEIDLVGTDCKVWMGVPLRVENNIIGVMCLQDYNNENKFSRDDLNVLDFIANQIAVAIQRRIMLDNLITARQKAEEAAQSKQLFMSTMSHEIRTPLNEVIGITNLLLQGNPREDQMDFIKTLRFSGNHLLTLVNDVLDYNKMESGKIVFEQTQFNFNDFLEEIMRSYSFRSKAKNLDFKINKEGDLPEEVIGDQIRLNQILSNLLSNALKFTNQGGITVTIREIERKEGKSQMEFSVRDTGIGIPKEKHSVIFESFTQASSDTTRRFGGTGLGLAICKKLVELQGGTIKVISEPGSGSTFIFTLLLEVSDKNMKPSEGEAAESYIGLEGKRILIAEDNKINFFVANKFLTGWGVIVSHAENGQLALEEIEKEDFDLVLMDLHMPIMDGIEATRIIRESTNPRIRNIPIVALTAAIMSESHDKIDKLNINDYVLKPFKPHDLFERIRKHVK
ncbi:MAG TPA: ATP-binding protein [Bacteroidales bacterium]|mgnify:FL=1|jgi:PAS domain S-box-containing protein|nr:MAG: Autoinducer 2 sensor kinase/phosphatase LuxQ [Bacteroidetes bacterium ADurb.Bin145]HOU01365.1 ATP-binding protein [Bacteroidales bacterium]HQG63134.1 ATP-binding protein [Bacteroidales bacterium]HQK67448.1 ATP-binding protein [Bacteroidales bacterium]